MPLIYEPPDWVLSAILAPTAFIVRHVDIYEEDGITPWYLDAPFESGSVTVDSGSEEERRNFDLSLFKGTSNAISIGNRNGLWYDKIVKIFRGVRNPSTQEVWEVQLGEFMIDQIDQQHFPHTVKVNGRDYTKKLIRDEFARTTAFAKGTPLHVAMKAIAINGGISSDKIMIPTVTNALGKDYIFEDGTARFKAMKDMATSFGYDLYFDAAGFLMMQEQSDPSLDPIDFTFEIGAERGNLASWRKSVNDTRLYNHVVVKGEGAGIDPVIAEAENTNPSSPTSVDAIGRRTYRYVSKFISTLDQAQDVADKFLKIHTLEEYNVDMESLVIPWMEAGTVIEFLDPDPNDDQPTRFALHDFTIPLGLGSMRTNARRAQIIS